MCAYVAVACVLYLTLIVHNSNKCGRGGSVDRPAVFYLVVSSCNALRHIASEA